MAHAETTRDTQGRPRHPVPSRRLQRPAMSHPRRALGLLAASLALAVATPASAQTCPGPDGFAPNHTCLSATNLGVSSLVVERPMTITDAEPDYFRLGLDFGSEVHIRAEFDHDAGDIDVIVYREDQCDTGPPLASSATDQDVETIRFVPSFEVIVKVLRNGGPAPCTDYTLSILRSRTPTLGGTLCYGNPNSTGFFGGLSASGSTSVAANDFHLNAGGLPQGAFGMFANGATDGFLVPPASSGLLCIGGGIGRFNRPGEIQAASPLGTVTLDVDLLDLPRPNGVVAVQPGDSWAFQFWYRDVTPTGAPTSNLTSAVLVWFD